MNFRKKENETQGMHNMFLEKTKQLLAAISNRVTFTQNEIAFLRCVCVCAFGSNGHLIIIQSKTSNGFLWVVRAAQKIATK